MPGAYGWRDFDPEVVEGLVENDARFINRRANGWIACPLNGHFGEELAWQEDNYRKGSVPHGDPPASFRAAPTYVLERPVDNVIVGQELIPARSRLGHENSEDALTWNVFRSLQEAGRLTIAAHALVEAATTVEPELYFWGRRVALDASNAWAELQRVRGQLETGGGQQTEPDACLYVAGWGWVFVEAKFGSSTDVYDDPSRIEAWLARYAAACPGVFDDEAIRKVKLREFPQQLLRNVAFAHKLRAEGEHAVVVALVRENDPADVERWVGRCLAETADVRFRRVTWESLYRALDPADARLGALRLYLENKSYGLRPAFALHDDDPEEQPA